MAKNWERIIQASRAGRMAGDALGGVGTGIYQAFNQGMTPEQVVAQRIQLEDEKRRRGYMLEDATRNFQQNKDLQRLSHDLSVQRWREQQNGTPMFQGGFQLVKNPDGSFSARQIPIMGVPSESAESMASETVPSVPRTDATVKEGPEASLQDLGTPGMDLSGSKLPLSEVRPNAKPEPQQIGTLDNALLQQKQQAMSSRTLTPNARLEVAKAQGKAGVPLEESVAVTDEEKAAHQAAFKTRSSPDKLRKEFNNLAEVKSYKEISRQMGIMRSAYAQLGTGVSKAGIDQALITTFNKILDPTSVVRESEYARTPEGAALLRRIEGRIEQYTRGGVAFTDAERADLLQVAEALYSNAQSTYDETKDFYLGLAERQGANPIDIIQGLKTDPVETPKSDGVKPIQIKSIRRKE